MHEKAGDHDLKHVPTRDLLRERHRANQVGTGVAPGAHRPPPAGAGGVVVGRMEIARRCGGEGVKRGGVVVRFSFGGRGGSDANSGVGRAGRQL